MDGRMCIVGLGGAGCKVIGRLADSVADGPVLAAVSTDGKALESSRATKMLQIGAGLTSGHGTGGDVGLGRRVAEQDRELLRSLFEGVDLAFLVVALGGGTGTGAAPVVLDAAREAGATVLCFATLPFPFESRSRRDLAEGAVAGLVDVADGVVLVPNEQLFEAVGESKVADAFALADEVLAGGVCALWKMIAQPGVIGLDFAHLQKVIRRSAGACALGYGDGRGKGRASTATAALLDGPLLVRGETLAGAASVLVSVVGGPDLTLQEVGEIMDAVNARTSPGAEVSMGTVIDTAWRNRVTIVALVSAGVIEPAAETDAEDEPAAPAGPGEPGVKKRRKGATPSHSQAELKLGFSSKGRFKDVEPTVLDGEDLDVPTYIRRGLSIDR